MDGWSGSVASLADVALVPGHTLQGRRLYEQHTALCISRSNASLAPFGASLAPGVPPPGQQLLSVAQLSAGVNPFPAIALQRLTNLQAIVHSGGQPCLLPSGLSLL
jgi:hypothetical protein